jgi:hypothetical protein
MQPNLGMSLGKRWASVPSMPIRTTLYELVKSVSEEVPEEEDHLVAQVITQLLQGKRVKFLGDLRTIEADFS